MCKKAHLLKFETSSVVIASHGFAEGLESTEAQFCYLLPAIQNTSILSPHQIHPRGKNRLN